MCNILADDCIREVMKHLDLLDLLYISEMNERLEVIAAEKMKRVKFCSDTIGIDGTIGILNFAYIISKFRHSIHELSVSMEIFPSYFNHYLDHQKCAVLSIIHRFVGPQLKTINLHKFDIDNSGKVMNIAYFLTLLTEKNIQVNELP